MKRFASFLGSIFLCSAFAEPAVTNWPSFRGPNASGVAEGFKTPEKWSGFKWSTAIPGLGHSCPVIWADRLFVTTATTTSGDEKLKVGLYGNIEPVEENAEYSWEVLCLDKSEGRVIWRKTAHHGAPKMKRHPKSSHANSTPATDGRHVLAFFGAEGLFCYDMDGNLLWQRNFDGLNSGYYVVPAAQWGFGSSPVIHGNMVFVQCDVQANSFLAALSLKDGKDIWKAPRTDVPTWSTPTVAIQDQRGQVIANGYKHAGGYELTTGKELWKLSGGGDIPTPTPVVSDGLVFLTSAHGRLAPIYAVRLNATGNVSLEGNRTNNDFIAWSTPRGGNYMQTPVVLGDYLYACKDNGIASCYVAKTGELKYSERLGTGMSGFTASPVAADGKIYFTSEEGTVYVLKAGPKFELLATNVLGETCMATPAISAGEIFFRTRNHLSVVAAR